MVTLAESNGGNIVPEGSQLGILYQIIDLGTQKREYQGDIKHTRRLRITFEVPDCPMEDGRPLSIGAEVTNSSHEKAKLTKWLKAWIGVDNIKPGFELDSLLGRAALLSISHYEVDGKKRASIDHVARPPASMKAPAQHNPSLSLTLEQGSFDADAFQRLPDWLRNMIASSPEYCECTGESPQAPASKADALDDEIPF